MRIARPPNQMRPQRTGFEARRRSPPAPPARPAPSTASSTPDSPSSSRSRTAPIHRRRIDRRPRTRRWGCSCTPTARRPAVRHADSTFSVPTSIHRIVSVADRMPMPGTRRRMKHTVDAATRGSHRVAIANIAAHHLNAQRRQAPDTRRGQSCARDRRAPTSCSTMYRPRNPPPPVTSACIAWSCAARRLRLCDVSESLGRPDGELLAIDLRVVPHIDGQLSRSTNRMYRRHTGASVAMRLHAVRSQLVTSSRFIARSLALNDQQPAI